MGARTSGDWLIIRIELTAVAGEAIAPPPGRDFLVSLDHSMLDFAVAIDTAFARWDLGHLRAFRLPDGVEHVIGDLDEGAGDQSGRPIRVLGLDNGSAFEYVFDFGDEWMHHCEVRAAGLDPEDEFDEAPPGPVPIFGWGTIPDQYGRTAPDD